MDVPFESSPTAGHRDSMVPRLDLTNVPGVLCFLSSDCQRKRSADRMPLRTDSSIKFRLLLRPDYGWLRFLPRDTRTTISVRLPFPPAPPQWRPQSTQTPLLSTHSTTRRESTLVPSTPSLLSPSINCFAPTAATKETIPLPVFDDPNIDKDQALLGVLGIHLSHVPIRPLFLTSPVSEDDSPYPEVRSAVANTDDPTVPVNTLRTWVIGTSPQMDCMITRSG